MTGSPYPRSDRDLLSRIRRSPGEKAGYKQLIRELGLGGGRERRLLLEQLARMVARRELVQVGDRMWSLPPSAPATETAHAAAAKYQSTQQKSLPDAKFREATFLRTTREHLVSGRLEVHRDGYGFVRVADEKGRVLGASSPAGDIFIPPTAMYGAMHGDTVLVDEDAPGRDGRRSGRVARVLTRRNPTVVGIFHYGEAPRRGSARSRQRTERGSFEPYDSSRFESGAAGNYVQPWDERMGFAILIPPGEEVVEGALAIHRTLGHEAVRKAAPAAIPEPTTDASPTNDTPEEANPAEELDLRPARVDWRTEREGARWPLEGLAVEVEITRFPQPGRPALGRVLEVLGPPDAFGVDVEIIIRKHALPHTFPAHVLAEAEQQAGHTVASLPGDELALREDFRSLPIITIDGESARDFDDAVLVRSLANGNTELQVHIADVSHYVLPGSALDLEARLRGTSVYFPDRAVPMLPHALSSGMCSLRPMEDRLVLSCIMEVDGRGEIAGYRVLEGVIRSARRMTYTSVQHCLNASPQAARWNERGEVTPTASAEDVAERERVAAEQPDLPPALDGMLELALRLNGKRMRRGSIDFDMPEPVIDFDPEGNMQAILRSERGWAHRLIEEFMLSANECVATWLTVQRIPSMYRIHEVPDPKRVVEFEEAAAAFGQTLGIGALPVRRLTIKGDRREAQRRLQRGRDHRPAHQRDSQREIPEHIAVTPQMYQRLVRRIAGKPEERILSYLMLRSLKQARYAEVNEGHFALASPCYTHFTSPIRRYPDLVVHRLIRAMLRGNADPQGAPVLSTDALPWGAMPAHERGRSQSLAPAMQTEAPARQIEAPARGRNGRIGWTTPEADELPAPRPDTGPGGSRLSPAGATAEPISAQEMADIAVESSQAERRAADAERELIEWKKMKFMADRIGEDFTGMILSVTKFGFFVELDALFVEGLVPLTSLVGDFYYFRDADRAICGQQSGHCFRVGDRVKVILDRIDHQQRRLQFALLPGTEPTSGAGAGSRRARRKGDNAGGTIAKTGSTEPTRSDPGRPGKIKRAGKAKDRRRRKR